MTTTTTLNPVNILLVEDNPGDVQLTREAFKEERMRLVHLDAVEDGESAINYLSQQSPYENVSKPDLVLLDINLPGMNGIEVLEYIKVTSSLKSIPVVMLTTSQSEKDIALAYDRYANCYLIKPTSFSEFVEAIKQIEKFWFDLVQLPRQVESN